MLAGLALYRARSIRMREKGHETLTDPVRHLLATLVEPMRAGIEKAIADAKAKPGPRATAVPMIDGMDHNVVALLTLRCLLDRVSQETGLTGTAERVGRSVQSELDLQALETQNPGLFKWTQRYVEESPLGFNEQYRIGVLLGAARRGAVVTGWTKEQRIHLGTFLINVAIESTGVVRMDMRKKGRKSGWVLVAGEGLDEWISKQHTRCELLHPPRLPMVSEPLPYRHFHDGGYLTKQMRGPLVRSRGAEHRHTLMTDDRQAVYRTALNAVMSVPYRVNARVLEVMNALWEGAGTIPKLVDRDLIPLPQKPPPDADKRTRERYKVKAKEVYFANIASGARRIVASQTMSIANRLRDRPIWFPMFYDFRGRMYTAPQYLTPQGNDLAKGLLTFDRGVPIGERGGYWLAVHLANCFGVDKVSLDERVEWVEKNRSEIIATAEDPLTHRWWMEADAPVSFLAAAFEWLGYQNTGSSFITHLPITVDGSCNGVQHLAALCRDAAAGEYVNLIPGDKPRDLYKRVADRAIEIIDTELATMSPDHQAFASMWREYGIDRKLTKRPTMILPYGGTLRAVERYVNDRITEKLIDGVEHPFGERRQAAVNWMATIVWRAMNDVVRGPRAVMNWTKAVAAVVSTSGRALSWRTPSGFPVRQAYLRTSDRRVKTRLGDRIVKLVITEDTDRLDKRRQAQGFSPNLTHSYDAAALHLTVYEMVKRGVVDLLVIHDSYGTHAPNMDLLGDVLREQFVLIYQQETLELIRSSIVSSLPEKYAAKVPPIPELGTLDVGGVRRSRYFFA